MSGPLVVVDEVSFRYPQPGGTGEGPLVLNRVSLTLSHGEILAIVGHNGSGKTTLARHLNGLLKPTAGRVLVAGLDTRQATVATLAAHVGYAFQNPDHQLFAPTVADEVAFGPRNLGLTEAEVTGRVAAALAALDLSALTDRHPLLLGYGIRRLVALAGVMALGAPLLVLDEPTVGLDHRAVERVLGVLRARRQQDEATLIISHDLAIVAAWATRVVALGAGRVVADGPPRAVLADQSLLRQAGLAPPTVVRLAGTLVPFGVRPDVLTPEEFCDSYASVWRATWDTR